MLVALIFFIASAAGLVALFWHKVFELRKGEPMFSPGIRARGDLIMKGTIMERTDALVAGGKRMGKQFVKKSGQMSHAAAYKTLHTVHGSLSKTLEKMKGKKSPKNSNKAPASFFLQNVSEYKNGLQNDTESKLMDEQIDKSLEGIE